MKPQSNRLITRVSVAYEAGRDGFRLTTQGIGACLMHASSVAVSRRHRRAGTGRPDSEMLMRAGLGWLDGEKHHCAMAGGDLFEEEARRPNPRARVPVRERTRLINRMKAILTRFAIRSFKPTLRDRRAVACYGVLTGSPDESDTRAARKGWCGPAMLASGAA